MTHDAKDRPKFYPIREEARWLFHNAVAHPVTGVLCFTAALLHHTGSKTISKALLAASEAIHDWSMPERP